MAEKTIERVCLSHNKVFENGVWVFKNVGKFLLYVRRPVLITKCDECVKEANLRQMIIDLRSQNK